MRRCLATGFPIGSARCVRMPSACAGFTLTAVHTPGIHGRHLLASHSAPPQNRASDPTNARLEGEVDDRDPRLAAPRWVPPQPVPLPPGRGCVPPGQARPRRPRVAALPHPHRDGGEPPDRAGGLPPVPAAVARPTRLRKGVLRSVAAPLRVSIQTRSPWVPLARQD